MKCNDGSCLRFILPFPGLETFGRGGVLPTQVSLRIAQLIRASVRPVEGPWFDSQVGHIFHLPVTVKHLLDVDKVWLG